MKSKIYIDNEKSKSILLWLQAWLNSAIFDNLIVNVIGGEPFLNLDPVFKVNEVLKRSRIKNYGFKFITNGTLINESVLYDLKDLPVFDFQLTFDGGRKNHNNIKFDTFDNLIRVANLLVENRFHLDIRINYPKGDFNFVLDALDELGTLIPNKKGINVYFSHIVEDSYLNNSCSLINQDFDNRKLLYEKSLKLGFGISNPISSIVCLGESDSSFVIGPDCKVYKCFNGVGVDNADIGSIIDGRLVVSSYKQLSRDIPNKCQECKYLPLCHGGCHLKKSLHNDDMLNECLFSVYQYLESDLLPLYLKQIINRSLS